MGPKESFSSFMKNQCIKISEFFHEVTPAYTTKKMKFSVEDFFSKCEQMAVLRVKMAWNRPKMRFFKLYEKSI